MNNEVSAERAFKKTRFLAEIFGMCETVDGRGYHDRPIHLSEEGRSGLETILSKIAEDLAQTLNGEWAETALEGDNHATRTA